MKIEKLQDSIWPAMPEKLADYLERIGYYEKPGSLRHHVNGTGDGSLYKHSVEVMNQLMFLTERLGLTWMRPESPKIVGLLHDVCKCDDYIKIDGEWQYNKNKTMAGHGDKSVIMLSGHIELTDEEVLCIRYHMGAFTDKEEWQYYGKAVEKYPNVLYTHTADMIASKVLGI